MKAKNKARTYNQGLESLGIEEHQRTGEEREVMKAAGMRGITENDQKGKTRKQRKHNFHKHVSYPLH